LPWGTPEEEFIPAPLVFEAEMALARAQLATQTPSCPPELTSPQPTAPANTLPPSPMMVPQGDGSRGSATSATSATTIAFQEELPVGDSRPTASPAPAQSELSYSAGMTGATPPYAILPPNWPDERGFIPPPPSPLRPPCIATNVPVMTHTRIYHGNDSEFTAALASYYHFRDDARIGGWQNYLQRSDDFIRFCCHMHISEMLSARGGAGETRVVWRWPDSR
jgi:hypothetical protein